MVSLVGFWGQPQNRFAPLSPRFGSQTAVSTPVTITMASPDGIEALRTQLGVLQQMKAGSEASVETNFGTFSRNRFGFLSFKRSDKQPVVVIKDDKDNLMLDGNAIWLHPGNIITFPTITDAQGVSTSLKIDARMVPSPSFNGIAPEEYFTKSQAVLTS